MVEELRRRQLQFVFVVFRAQWPTPVDQEDWRDQFLEELLRELRVPAIQARHVLVAEAAAQGRRADEFFVAGDGYPTTEQNRLIALKMKDYVTVPAVPSIR
jgi:hypothetical protein